MEAYVIVQHSGYGYGHDLQFKRGLETRAIGSTGKIREAVEKFGGIVFDNYGDAENFCEDAMYPEDYNGITPIAQGEFGAMKVDELAIYIPVRKVVG